MREKTRAWTAYSHEYQAHKRAVLARRAFFSLCGILVVAAVMAAGLQTLFATSALSGAIIRNPGVSFRPPYGKISTPPDEDADENALHSAQQSSTSGRSLRFKETAMLSALPGTSAMDEDDGEYVSNRSVGSYNAPTVTKIKPPGKVEMLDWFEKGNRAFPIGTQAKVIDVETGRSFNVKRFSGIYHADSYPLTKADTAVMKRVYGGKWSWNRRAIWLVVGKRVLAASMNGMPHMRDANLDDDFEGHFCIHFYKSLIHKTANECPDHQSMVMKAYLTGKRAAPK